ncbi:unnamed protein product [Macrosiphum euphorbiae]|nr:unnamed protein product [Macrosiphum euphorbiae]
MRTLDDPSGKVPSLDRLWTFNSDRDTSLPTSRAVDVAEICPSVAVKICPAAKTTDTITKVGSPQPDLKPIDAHKISLTITNEQAPTVEVCPTCDHQQVRSSRTLLSFDDFYGIDGKDVWAKPYSSG